MKNLVVTLIRLSIASVWNQVRQLDPKFTENKDSEYSEDQLWKLLVDFFYNRLEQKNYG